MKKYLDVRSVPCYTVVTEFTVLLIFDYSDHVPSSMIYPYQREI